MNYQDELIYEACTNKNIKLKIVCEDLNLNYESIRTALKRSKLKADVLYDIAEYLDINIKDLMKSKVKKKEGVA